MTGETLNNKRHLEITFGKYCQIHEEENPHNITITCTRGTICMNPSGNKQVGLNFMNLESMKKVVRRSWDALPMPDTVIARVNSIDQGKPNDLDFLDRKKLPIREIDIIGVYSGENEAPNIELIEPETYIDPI